MLQPEHRVRPAILMIMFRHAPPQIADFFRQTNNHFRQRVADFLGIGNHHALAITQHNVPWHSDDCRIIWNVPQHHRPRAHAAVFTDCNIS